MRMTGPAFDKATLIGSIAGDPNKPILDAARWRVKNNTLNIAATNVYYGATVTVNVADAEDGEWLIPATPLCVASDHLFTYQADVTCVFAKRWVTVSSGGVALKINYMSGRWPANFDDLLDGDLDWEPGETVLNPEYVAKLAATHRGNVYLNHRRGMPVRLYAPDDTWVGIIMPVML